MLISPKASRTKFWTRLAKVADLKVISRTSTQRFKSAPSDLREIAKQLGVMNIVEGSVQKANDQVRVNVQLINAMTDAHLWADTYDRKIDRHLFRRKRDRQDDCRHLAGEADRLGETDDGRATHDRHNRL